MAKYLKNRKIEERFQVRRAVASAVSEILRDVQTEEDVTLGARSQRRDCWSPPSFLVPHENISTAAQQILENTWQDIPFAQTPIRQFAQSQPMNTRPKTRTHAMPEPWISADVLFQGREPMVFRETRLCRRIASCPQTVQTASRETCESAIS